MLHHNSMIRIITMLDQTCQVGSGSLCAALRCGWGPRTKALLALSAMVRHNDEALEELLQKGGVEALVHIIKDDDLRNQR